MPEHTPGPSFDGYNLIVTLECGCCIWLDANDARAALAGKPADPAAEYGPDQCPMHAAAPELLAVLEFLLAEELRDGQGNSCDDVIRAALCKAR